MLLKLHKQFGHASKFPKLLRSSENKNADCFSILKQIIDSYGTCQRFGKPKPKPAVGLPLASEYNETVAIDLVELERGTWYLHFIDEFTRFSASSIVNAKRPSEIVKNFIHSWISVHGPPRKIFHDNGNDEFRNMAENINIETKTMTA